MSVTPRPLADIERDNKTRKAGVVGLRKMGSIILADGEERTAADIGQLLRTVEQCHKIIRSKEMTETRKLFCLLVERYVQGWYENNAMKVIEAAHGFTGSLDEVADNLTQAAIEFADWSLEGGERPEWIPEAPCES